MEVFDDRWGPVGSLGRSVTRQELKEWWVTLVNVLTTEVFDATGPNLSKIGTDAQLLTAGYTKTRQWAQRLMDHPQGISGILYRSRHDPVCLDLALFQRPVLLPARLDTALNLPGRKHGPDNHQMVCIWSTVQAYSWKRILNSPTHWQNWK